MEDWMQIMCVVGVVIGVVILIWIKVKFFPSKVDEHQPSILDDED
jgi:hypothetical protein